MMMVEYPEFPKNWPKYIHVPNVLSVQLNQKLHWHLRFQVAWFLQYHPDYQLNKSDFIREAIIEKMRKHKNELYSPFPESLDPDTGKD